MATPAEPELCGRVLLTALKAAARSQRPGLVLAVGSPPGVLLRPVASRPGQLDADDVRRLTCWRNRHVHSFLTEFRATEERTARWLVDVVGRNDGKILFMAGD